MNPLYGWNARAFDPGRVQRNWMTGQLELAMQQPEGKSERIPDGISPSLTIFTLHALLHQNSIRSLSLQGEILKNKASSRCSPGLVNVPIHDCCFVLLLDSIR